MQVLRIISPCIDACMYAPCISYMCLLAYIMKMNDIPYPLCNDCLMTIQFPRNVCAYTDWRLSGSSVARQQLKQAWI